MDWKKRVATLLKTYRNLKGLSQEEVAAKVSMAQTQYNLYERAKKTPKVKNLTKLIKFLEIPPEKIFGLKPIGDETFEKFCDRLNDASDLYEFINYYSANKKKFKNFSLIEVFEELAKTPENKRKKLTKELRKLRLMVEE